MNAYLTAFSMAYRRTFRAPGELITNSLFYLALVVMFAALWKAVTESTGGSIVGYNHRAMVCYLIASECAYAATRPTVIEEIGDEIRDKSIEAEMLRPASVFRLRYATELGTTFARSTSLFAIGLFGGIVMVGGFPNWPVATLAIPYALISMACNVAGLHIFGAAGFWMSDTRPGLFMYQKLIFLLGCMLMPVQIFPAAVQTVIWILPFWTMAYAPARLASGHFEPLLIVGQLAWLAVLVWVASRVFASGERRLQRMGG